jgi:hypothetical protein
LAPVYEKVAVALDSVAKVIAFDANESRMDEAGSVQISLKMECRQKQAFSKSI